jgi:hypothetical protein
LYNVALRYEDLALGGLEVAVVNAAGRQGLVGAPFWDLTVLYGVSWPRPEF